MLLSLLIGHHSNRIRYRVLAAADIGQGAFDADRNHDPLLYHIRLLYRTDDIAAAHLVAHID